ncbi:hypothetical protein KBZ94_19750 [Streptomyces sp. RM72]|uniref:hypothetical protein n=1 Tax=unclassified Streptomyces TaxID=2593676 RepID=UPI000EF5CCEC|nr:MULTISPECIES: hypothetical protein [unclassified Streptomyces]MBQ0887144.1 hypothetical protein [Streptomyces sp. RM72]
MPVLVSLALDKGLDLLGTTVGQWLLVGLFTAAAAGFWLYLRSRATPPVPPRVRSFTLLRTEGSDGTPVQYETTRPTGTKVTHWVGGRQRLFELTDVQMEDGTYAAEPVDHF